MAERYNRLQPWRGRGVNLVSFLSWPYVQRTISGGNVIYEGKHTNPVASNDDSSWVITKFTYDADNNCLKEQTLIGSWTGKAGLSW